MVGGQPDQIGTAVGKAAAAKAESLHRMDKEPPGRVAQLAPGEKQHAMAGMDEFQRQNAAFRHPADRSV